MLNSIVQKQPLLIAHASTFLQAAPRAVGHMGCKDVFVEVFAMAVFGSSWPWQAAVRVHLATALLPHMAYLSSCCQQSWSLAVTHTHAWCPLHKISSVHLKSLCVQGISGITFVSLIVDLFVTYWPYDGQPDASPRPFLGMALLLFPSMNI